MQIQPGAVVLTSCPVGSCNIHGDTVPMSGWSVPLDCFPLEWTRRSQIEHGSSAEAGICREVVGAL